MIKKKNTLSKTHITTNCNLNQGNSDKKKKYKKM